METAGERKRRLDLEKKKKVCRRKVGLREAEEKEKKSE